MLAALSINPSDLVSIHAAGSDEERVLKRARSLVAADKTPARASIDYFGAHRLGCSTFGFLMGVGR